MDTLSLVWIVAQTLTERNPASRLSWVVGGLALAILGVVFLVEIWDTVRDALRRAGERRHGEPVVDREPAASGDGLLVREPRTRLRGRFFQRIRPHRRPWSEGRANEPSLHWETPKSGKG